MSRKVREMIEMVSTNLNIPAIMLEGYTG